MKTSRGPIKLWDYPGREYCAEQRSACCSSSLEFYWTQRAMPKWVYISIIGARESQPTSQEGGPTFSQTWQIREHPGRKIAFLLAALDFQFKILGLFVFYTEILRKGWIEHRISKVRKNILKYLNYESFIFKIRLNALFFFSPLISDS